MKLTDGNARRRHDIGDSDRNAHEGACASTGQDNAREVRKKGVLSLLLESPGEVKATSSKATIIRTMSLQCVVSPWSTSSARRPGRAEAMVRLSGSVSSHCWLAWRLRTARVPQREIIGRRRAHRPHRRLQLHEGPRDWQEAAGVGGHYLQAWPTSTSPRSRSKLCMLNDCTSVMAVMQPEDCCSLRGISVCSS